MLLDDISSQVHPLMGIKECQRPRRGVASAGRRAEGRVAVSWLPGETGNCACCLLVCRVPLIRTLILIPYRCFCGSTPDPKPPRLAMPHSCASPCTRPRACGHPCPLSCHPGPCPPCQITTQTPCFCGKQVLSFRCANLAPGRASHSSMRSCNNVCGKKLNCGNHTCENTCHDGPCAPCTVREPAMCYCGKTEKELGCGIGEEKTSVVIENDTPRSWIGRFQCQSTCERCVSQRYTFKACSL